MRSLLRVSGLALASFAGTALASDYVFTPGAIDAPAVTLEAATGTRDAGAFGGHGTEGLAQLELAPADGWAVALRAGLLDDRASGATANGYGAEARYMNAATRLGAGLGFRRDYDGARVPYARLTWSPWDAAYPLALSGIVEVPRGEHRDGADVLVSAAQALPCVASLDCALEIAGEDLEGFVEDDAEGGAKFVVGPTLAWRRADRSGLRLFAGWIHAATANDPARAGFPDYRGQRDGFMLRLATQFGTEGL